jgi:hypothetical protein
MPADQIMNRKLAIYIFVFIGFTIAVLLLMNRPRETEPLPPLPPAENGQVTTPVTTPVQEVAMPHATSEAPPATSPKTSANVVFEPPGVTPPPVFGEPVLPSTQEPTAIRLSNGTLVRSDDWEAFVAKNTDTDGRQRQLEFQLLAAISESQRKPENTSMHNTIRLQRHQIEQLAGKSISLEDLPARVREHLVHRLEGAESFSARRLIYADAFKCGFPPESLLAQGTPEDQAALKSVLAGEITDKTIQQIHAISDSEEKADMITLRYVNRSDDELDPGWAKVLKGVPSRAMIDRLEQYIRTDPSTDQILECVELIGHSNITASIPALLLLAESNSDDAVVNAACLQLGKWGHRKGVLSILHRRLLENRGGALESLPYFLWGLNGGTATIAKIIRESRDPVVRDAAVESLAMHRFDDNCSELLWSLTIDERLSVATRAQTLRICRRKYIRADSSRHMAVEMWTEKSDALGEAAKYLLASERPVSPRAERDMVKTLSRGLRMVRHEAKLVREQGPTNDLDELRLKNLEDQITLTEKLLDQLDKSGKWRESIESP